MSRTTRDPRTLIPERDVQRACIAVLRHYGVTPRRQNAGMIVVGQGRGRRVVRAGQKDEPDLRGELPGGRSFACEVKRFGKWPRPGQIAKLIALNEAGGVGLWVDRAETLERVLPRLIAGWRVEMESDGSWSITDEPREAP